MGSTSWNVTWTFTQPTWTFSTYMSEAETKAWEFLREKLGEDVYRKLQAGRRVAVALYRRPIFWPFSIIKRWRGKRIIAEVDAVGYLYLEGYHTHDHSFCVGFHTNLPLADRIFLKVFLLCADPNSLLKVNGRNAGWDFAPAWRVEGRKSVL